MNTLKLYIVILIFSFTACTDIGIIEEDIPFEEKIIVYGRLKGGTNEINISFSKNFPVDEELSIEDAALTDIISYLWSESQGIFPLTYNKAANNYIPIDNFNVELGTEYELHAMMGNNRIYAKTIIPEKINIQEISLIENYISCKILPANGIVYGCKYKISPLDDALDENVFFEISEETINPDEVIEIRTSSLPLEYLSNLDQYTINLEVYSFDSDYREYYYSRKNNKPIENIFSEGGGSVFWNVHGENAIGMFIGYSVEEIRNIKFN